MASDEAAGTDLAADFSGGSSTSSLSNLAVGPGVLLS